MKYVVIQLTPAEADIWDWAADPMIEYWDNDNEEGRDDGIQFDEDPIKFAKKVNGGNGSEGQIHPHKNVIEDMIYRLEDQLDGMTDNELCGNDGKGSIHTKNHMSAMRDKKFLRKVVEKIKAIPIEFGA